MKPLLSLLIAAACLGASHAQAPKPTPAQLAEALYRQGQAAEKTGDVAAARKAYSAALVSDPNHAGSRFSLGQLKLNEQSITARAREAKFGAVTVPEIRLDGATLQESLDALGLIIEKQSKETVTPNFVVQDPKNQFAETKISLNLKNLPAAGVMKYLMEQAGAKARYDEHAIVIVPK